MKKLAVFDLDSTLLDGESINVILNHRLKDPKQRRKLEHIRARGMAGEIDLETSLKQRIAFFKGLELKQLQTMCIAMPWTTGAKETISELKKRGYLTVCLSGAFRTLTRRVIGELGVDAYCCNTLEHHNGILTGNIFGDLMHHESKGIVLKKIQAALSISPADTLVVGDGANDLSMFNYADSRIAFRAQEILKSHASHIVDKKDLREILKI